MAEVLQCDRDSAVFLFSTPDDAACRAGKLDHTQAVQAFAAHREAAEKAERQAVVETFTETVENHKAWIAKHPERHKECFESLLGTIECWLAVYGDHRKG